MSDIKLKKILNDDRKLALLALSSQKNDVTPCPPAEDMALFLSNCINEEKKQSILAHLETCPVCYQEWLSSPVLEESLINYIPNYLKNIIKKINLIFFIKYIFPISILITLLCYSISNIKSSVPVPMNFILASIISLSFFNIITQKKKIFQLSSVISICIVFLMFWPQKISYMINDTYYTAVEKNLAINDKRHFLWEKNSFGASTIEYSNSSIAFASGLWSGRQFFKTEQQESMPDFLTLKSKVKNWEETDWAIYFWLGKWIYIFKNVCIKCGDISNSFLNKQLLILEKIENNLNKLQINQNEKNIINKNFLKIKTIIKTSGSQSIDKKQCKNIVQYVDSIIEYYSPE